MKHGSLFSGIGGFDLAAEWMGWKNIFHCEWNDFGKKILKYYWPNAISYDDITKTDFTIHRGQIDILTGGFPCQPYSAAGKRLGTEDDRHLWPEMLRAIREIQPVYVVGENVRGLTNWNGGMVFDQVQADLEVQGYEVLPFLLPACAVNAPHRRDRIWFVAYCHNWRERRTTIERGWTEHKQQRGEIRSEFTTSGESGITPDPRLQRQEKSEQQTAGIEQCGEESATNSESVRSDRAQEHENRDRQSGKRRRCDTHNTGEIQERNIITNTNSRRQSGEEHRQTQPGFIAETSLPNNWRNFPTQSPVCSRNDGLSTRLDNITFPKWRNESIKGYGNAIVPNVAYQIFKAIEQHQNLTP